MTETTNTPAAAADPVAAAPVSTPVAQPAASSWLARARAWFSAAVAKVKAAAAAPATPQAQPAAGPDLVDTAPQPVATPGKARAWLSAAGSWLRNAAAWLVRKPALLGVLVLLALLIAAGALWPRLAPVQSSPPPEQTTAAVPGVNPLAELVTRLDEQDAMLAELQDQVAKLQDRPRAAQPSRSSSAQRPAAAGPAPASPPQQQRPAAVWGQTDLDRAISNFTPPTTFGAHE